MLRSFVYLDEKRLDEYIAQVEDGLRNARSRTANSEKSASGGTDFKIARAGLDKTSGFSETEEFVDSAPARFNRLTQLVTGHEEEFGWIEVLSDADLDSVRKGVILDVTADLYETDVTKLTGPNGILGQMSLLQQMQSGFTSWKEGAAGLPDKSQLDAMTAFGAAMPEMVLLGDVGESDWRIVAVLPAVPNAEGEAQVVGKVSRVIPRGQAEPLPGIPFIDQLPREQRRAFAKAGPTEGTEMMWVRGPAIVLDTLAIYR